MDLKEFCELIQTHNKNMDPNKKTYKNGNNLTPNQLMKGLGG